MPAYVIVDNEVTDPEGFREYQKRVVSTLEPYEGKFLVLDFLGIACGVVLGTTIGRIPSGMCERASVYTILLWQLLTGIVLLVGLRQHTLSKIKETL